MPTLGILLMDCLCRSRRHAWKCEKVEKEKDGTEKMPVIIALAVMKRKWLAMEAKMKIPRGGKRNKCRQGHEK